MLLQHVALPLTLAALVLPGCAGRAYQHHVQIGFALYGANEALVPVLAPLDCQITVVDPRREWLDRLPRGSTSISDFSEHIEDAIERAWTYATLK